MARGIRLFARLVVGIGSASLLVSEVNAQACGADDPCNIGQWAGPWDWTAQIEAAPACDRNDEFSHASLLPVGTHAGKVLLWRKDMDSTCGHPTTTETWLLDPSSPGQLIVIEHDPLDSDIFCAGQAWDSNGNLVVAGGVASSSGIPSETYRFDPRVLTLPAYAAALPPNPGYPYITAPNSWVKLTGDLNMPRYYPTLLSLNNGQLVGGTCTPASGSAQLVLGGPANTGGSQGNEVWSLLERAADSWSCPVVSERMTSSSFNWNKLQNPLPNEKYFMLPSNPANDFDLLDSYPRAFQLSNEQVFVAGDIDTNGNTPPAGNTPGTSWVIDPPRPSGDTWELRDGKDSADRYYGGAVLRHELGGLDRVLVFGGAAPATSTVHDTVQEFDRQGVDAQDGAWHTKASLTSKRAFCTAVPLPTGDILVVNGTTDLFSLVPNGVFQPELHSPGAGPMFLGSTRALAASNTAPAMASGAPPASTIREYHSFALLLQDGRVFIGGGERRIGPTPWPSPESMYSGEIFSPPYLFEPTTGGGSQPTVQPTIEACPGRIDYGTQFNIEATTYGGTIDRVVALRPGAITHHVDANQRYIELAFTAGGPGGNVLNVSAPTFDLAPQGHYMIFVIEHRTSPHDRRIPSVGKFVKFR